MKRKAENEKHRGGNSIYMGIFPYAISLIVLPGILYAENVIVESETRPSRSTVTIHDIANINIPQKPPADYSDRIRSEEKFWKANGQITDESKKWESFLGFYAVGYFAREESKNDFFRYIKNAIYRSDRKAGLVLKHYPELLLRLEYTKQEIDLLGLYSKEKNEVGSVYASGEWGRTINSEQARMALKILTGHEFKTYAEFEEYRKSEKPASTQPSDTQTRPDAAQPTSTQPAEQNKDNTDLPTTDKPASLPTTSEAGGTAWEL
jgi:hypothetical protein